MARNADSIDEIVKNTKHATASIRNLSDNLDKRTADITTGINKMTETATKQIEIVGGDAHRAILHIDKAVIGSGEKPATHPVRWRRQPIADIRGRFRRLPLVAGRTAALPRPAIN